MLMSISDARRLPRVLAAAVLLSSASTMAHAGEYPDRPIRMIVPSTPGGVQDVLARKVGAELSKRLDQNVVVENHAGANGAIATNLIARAPADGYLIGIGTPGTLSTNTFVQADLRYDPDKDLQPISLAIRTPVVLVVSANFPARNVAEFIAYAKAHPNTVTIANGGVGSSQFVSAHLFQNLTGIQLVDVPYQGGAAAMPDLINGRVAAYLNSPLDILPFVRKGQVRALAVAGSRRLDVLPDVPTLAEEGVRGFDFSAWYGFVGPHGLPPHVLAKLSSNIVDIMSTPEMKAYMEKLDYEVVADTPEQFKAEIAREHQIDASVLGKPAPAK
jgi:tripartite-type tricarboxylate transporter receptor subunit TctC